MWYFWYTLIPSFTSSSLISMTFRRSFSLPRRRLPPARRRSCKKEGEECCDKLGPIARTSIQPHTACGTYRIAEGKNTNVEEGLATTQTWLPFKQLLLDIYCRTCSKAVASMSRRPAGQIMTMMCTNPIFTCKFNLHKSLDYLPLLHQC